MADPRDRPEQGVDTEGASPGEQLVEACRRNNTELLQEIIDNAGGPEKAALLLNETTTVLGNHLYHEAALYGNYEVIDILLDQDGFECDPINRIEADTPLHSTVRFINSLPQPLSAHNSEFASELITMMIDAGSDPRIRNKAQLTAAQLCDPTNTKVRDQLNDAMDIVQNQGDYIVEDEEGEGEGEGEEDYAGSGSDSNFDAEEYRRERQNRGPAS